MILDKAKVIDTKIFKKIIKYNDFLFNFIHAKRVAPSHIEH
jgi:hypothetical protein